MTNYNAGTLPPEFLSALAERLPPDRYTADPAELLEYGRDATRVYTPAPSLLVQPRTTAEVAEVLRLCNAHRTFVVPSGGRTGLAGGAVAAAGEVVLSLGRMDAMEPVDELGLTVRVQAGAILAAVHRHCEEHGLTWPVDLAAKGSSQVGGNIATNAGGVKVVRHGLTRQWVLGLQVVTAAGDVLELGGALEKNNTGCDLRQLFIGSEGTLGVITAATLKLARLPEQLHVLLFAVPDLPSVLALFRQARRGPLPLSAFEFFTQACLDRVIHHRGLRAPLQVPAGASKDAAGVTGTAGTCYVLCEVERPRGVPEEVLEGWFADLLEQGLAVDGVLAQSSREAAELWALRESISETLSRTGLPHKNDVALPIAELLPFCAALEQFFSARYAEWEMFVFGHIGDGNLHINVMKPAALSVDEFRARTHAVDHDLFRLVQAHRGSISAEHGIGLLKKEFLGYSRAPAELALLKAIKRALDPHGILNPGKVLDP
jgi:FAD/FMN-containing dehydrogenase